MTMCTEVRTRFKQNPPSNDWIMEAHCSCRLYFQAATSDVLMMGLSAKTTCTAVLTQLLHKDDPSSKPNCLKTLPTALARISTKPWDSSSSLHQAPHCLAEWQHCCTDIRYLTCSAIFLLAPVLIG